MLSRLIVLAALFLLHAAEAVAVAAPEVASASITSLPLDGNWDFAVLESSYALGESLDAPEFPATGRTIAVPLNWYLAGVEHAGAALYRRTIQLPKERAGNRVEIEFEGVDYEATVWVNQKLAGRHRGYFSRFSFDISELVDADRSNEVTVLVNSPAEDTASWSQYKRLIKGVLSHHDTRPGGAWSVKGQDANTGGIWAPVRLHFSNSISIKSIEVTPFLLDDGLTQAHVRFRLDGVAPTKQPLQLRATLRPANFGGAPIDRTYNIDAPSDGLLEIALPKHEGAIWWPQQLGKPSLYNLELEIRQGAAVLDRGATRFGYRKVAFDPETGIWQINGKKLFLKGTNYIPTQWLSEMNKTKYVRDVSMMTDAHINAVRVHASIISGSFYDVADEAGMLVWQDFPLQWGYSDDQAFHDDAAKQAAEMVQGLFNHPSIVAWSMQNEPPWDAWWMKYKYENYDPNQNRELTARLAETVRSMDSTRHTHAYSATAEHTWQGWYSGHWRDFEKPTKTVLVAEYGAQALPNLPSLQKIFGVGTLLWPDTDAEMEIWSYHNFQPNETFNNAKISKGSNIGEFITNTQFYQSNLIRVAAESYRRQKYSPVGGIFQFMFVEDWPSVNWGIVDYWRNPKPGYTALKQAYQPVLPSIAGLEPRLKQGQGQTFAVWAVNDLGESLNDSELVIKLLSGKDIISETNVKFSIGADSATHVVDWSIPPLKTGHATVNATIVRAGKVLGTNRVEIIVDD